MKAFLLLVFLPLVASAQDATYTTIPMGGGDILYCANAPSGQQSCVMDDPNYWSRNGQTIVYTDQPRIVNGVQISSDPAPAADQPPQTFAFNTTESHTGGGGALELAMLLSVMLGQRIRRKG